MKKYYIHKNYSQNKPALRSQLINNNNVSKHHEYGANFPPNLSNSQNTGIGRALNTNHPYKKRLTKDTLKKKYIICPECGEHTMINIKNYKISLFGCKNKHKFDNILLKEFAKTQSIDLTKIKCEDCFKINKKDTEQNIFYRCTQCKRNVCPNCKYIHRNHKSIIDYDIKNYKCENHNLEYNLYCKLCKKNLCGICQKIEHNGHEIISFKSY